MILATIYKRRTGKGILFFILLCSTILLTGGNLYCQRLSAGTNLLNYLNFVTINAEVGLGVSQHFSLHLQGKYNPFVFKYNSDTKQINNRQISVAVGSRYWFWHSYSGWFVSAQAGFTRYNRGGIISQDTYEGDAYGVTLGAGYALMINRNLNIDFGAGIMSGFTDYVKYACPSCGVITGRDKKMFIAPNSILVQMSYLF